MIHHEKCSKEPTKIDYTLEQFLGEQKRVRHITSALECIVSAIEILDKRLEKLEKGENIIG